MPGTRIFLVDNGSYEPAATLALRGLAQEVGKLIGQEVRPVSTMHSTKIDPALLGGVPAVIFEGAVQQAKARGHRRDRGHPPLHRSEPRDHRIPP
jgi:hypothetical protein